MSDRVLFFNCIGISAIIHAAMFAVIPLQTTNIVPVPKKTLEVAYRQNIRGIKPEKFRPTQVREPEKPLEPLKKNSISEFIKKDLIPKSTDTNTSKPYALETQFEPKKSISLRNIPGETFKTPEYKSYYQIIREKIRHQAYSYYKNLEEGEVYLSFILASDGSVNDLIVIEKKTTASAYLTEIARRSVQEAAPYPAFPEKLKKNSQLSFNVSIAFEFK